MPNLLIVGDTNNGKTMLIRRFVELHPPEPRAFGFERRVLLIQAPPVPDERRLYFAILEALHAPYTPSGLTAAKMAQVVAVLKKVGVRMLIIDEIHHLMAGHLEKQRQFLNVLKYLSNEVQVSLVAQASKMRCGPSKPLRNWRIGSIPPGCRAGIWTSNSGRCS